MSRLITSFGCQGPKFSFLGRRQLAAEMFFFFSRQMENVVAKKC